MKVNLSMDDIRTKVEEYIKKAGRATGRPVLTVYYVMTADTTPDSERTNIMLALVAIVFPTSIEDVLGQLFMVGKGFAAVYAYKKVKKYITPQIKDKVEAKLDEWFHDNVTEVDNSFLFSIGIKRASDKIRCPFYIIRICSY